MNSIRRFFAFLFSASVGFPIFFYFPSFSLYLEDSYVKREAEGVLLPICFVPLFVLIILSSKQILQFFLNSKRLLDLMAIFIVAFIVIFNGASLLLALQITAGLILINLWPALLRYFTYSSIVAAIFSASGFAFLHLYDTGHVFYDQIASPLGFNDFPYIYGYFIYHAYVGLPEVFLVLSASGIMIYNSNHSQLHSNKKFPSNLAGFLSIFLMLYSLSYGRVSTIIAIALSLSAVVVLKFIALMRSHKLSIRSLKSLTAFGTLALSLVIALASSVQFILFAFSRFLLRIFEQGGSDRLDVWSQFLESFSKGDLISFLFGTSSTGSHNLFLDLLGRSGVIGAALFLFALVSGLRVVFDSLRRAQSVNLASSNPGLILFLVSAFVGNSFNVSFTQPWNIASYLFLWSALYACSTLCML